MRTSIFNGLFLYIEWNKNIYKILLMDKSIIDWKNTITNFLEENRFFFFTIFEEKKKKFLEMREFLEQRWVPHVVDFVNPLTIEFYV